MFLELRTYLFRAGTLDEALARFDRHLPLRLQFSAMAGMWAASSGQADRLIHIWPYDSMQQRMDIRAAAVATGKWPLPIRDILIGSSSMIIIPASFSPPLAPRQLGQCYELCIDQYLPGAMDDLDVGWSKQISQRDALAPLVACGRTEIGPLNHWVHLWAYRDVGHREETRQLVKERGIWPPGLAQDKLLVQESTILTPAWFSPLH